jgi:hypothetical protein
LRGYPRTRERVGRLARRGARSAPARVPGRYPGVAVDTPGDGGPLQVPPGARGRRGQGVLAQSFPTTKSMQAVSALTSSGSTEGNMPTRSWLRPSLR